MYRNHGAAWVGELNKLVAQRPATIAPRGMPIREMPFASFTVLDPLAFPMLVEGRELKHVIGVLEGLSLVGQVSVSETFTDRIRKFHDFTDDGVFHGAYGARVHGQVGDVYRTLVRDPDSRQAVLTIFDGTRDLDRPRKDIPCTLSIHFLLRGGMLNMGVTMRSNDIWLGTPYDLMQFSILQASLAQALDVEVGYYVHQAGSLHLYERDLEKAKKVTRTILTMARFGFENPIWALENEEPALRIAQIVARARSLLLDPGRFEAFTAFEVWAKAQLLDE